MATIDMGRKEGGLLCPRAELGLRLTLCGLGRGLLPYQVASSSIIDMVRKLGAVPLLGGAGSPNVVWAEAYLRTKWHLDPSGRLATTDMGQKLEGCVHPFVGSWVPI